jgi:hypothetical protein
MLTFYKIILQNFFKKKWITDKEYKEMIENIKTIFKEIEVPTESIDEINTEINNEIQFVHMKIQYLIHPKTKQKYFGIINEVGSKEDEVSKLSTQYSQPEIIFFKLLVPFFFLIIDTKNGGVRGLGRVVYNNGCA